MGCERTEECPICKKEMVVIDIDFPIEYISMSCDNCGFQGNMNFNMKGIISPGISEDQANSYLDQFIENFNELFDEDLEEYMQKVKLLN